MLEFLRKSLPTIGTVLAIGTFLAILAPYRTHQMGWPWVWVYWTGLMAFGWSCAAVIVTSMQNFLPNWRPLPFYGLMSVLISVPMTLAVVLVQLYAGSNISPLDLPVVFVMVWVISAAVTTIGYLGESRKAAADEESAAMIGNALLEKLPHNLRAATVLALESEDHYLRVHTDKGDALILMRLSDAIAAVEALDGAKTHRSWWVARTAVTDVSRGDGRAVLTLSNGVEAPVSRTFAPGLRDSGWY